MASNELDSLIAGMDSKPTNSNPKTEKGHYFIDQNTGQYYYQSNDSTGVIVNEDDTSASNTNTITTANDNQVVLNTGGDQYQTVTIGKICTQCGRIFLSLRFYVKSLLVKVQRLAICVEVS